MTLVQLAKPDLKAKRVKLVILAPKVMLVKKEPKVPKD